MSSCIRVVRAALLRNSGSNLFKIGPRLRPMRFHSLFSLPLTTVSSERDGSGLET